VKKIKILSICIIGVAICVFLLRNNFRIDAYDSFYDTELKLSSPKSIYALNEEIALTFSIIPTKEKRIRIYSDPSYSLTLHARRLKNDTDVDISDNDFGSMKTNIPENISIDTIYISPQKPYVLTITGKAYRENGNLIIDFDNYGKFIKDSSEKFLLWGYWYPIKHKPFDSLEDYTNNIKIKFSP